jgi:ATP-dependent Lhr-like helicase
MAMSTNLAERVRQFLCDREQWPRFPDDVRDWLQVLGPTLVLPRPSQLLVETFPTSTAIT